MKRNGLKILGLAVLVGIGCYWPKAQASGSCLTSCADGAIKVGLFICGGTGYGIINPNGVYDTCGSWTAASDACHSFCEAM